MTLDVPLLRPDTPGVANVLHFNNAGAALSPRPVLDAVINHQRHRRRRRQLPRASQDVYDAVATLIGAHRDEIAFVESVTRAWDNVHYYNDETEVDRLVRAVAG